MRLHSAQRDAVRHHAGPLLCLAGAGSGKTSVLTTRAAYLMAVHGVAPEALWLVTFTNKAAAEMRARLGRLPGVTYKMARNVQARTFHSFALALLQAYAPPFTLLAEERARHGFMKRVLRELRLHDSLQAETVLAALSALKARMLSPGEWKPTDMTERDMQRAMLRFEEQKAERSLKDFDDLLVDIVRMLQEDEALLMRLRRRFRYVMVDEFQDTTPVQYELIRLVTKDSRNLAVFGDDDQTIYTFNGACHKYITEFKARYTDAVQVTLSWNFRSTKPIVGLGNAIIRHNNERLAKTMVAVAQDANSSTVPAAPLYVNPRDADDEARFVAERIQTRVANGARPWSDFAVLYRTAQASRAVVEYFTMHEIPFRQFGAEPLFYDHGLVRPLIDHLRLALQPRNFNALESAVAALYVSRDAGMTYIRDADQQQAKKYPLVHLQSWTQLADFQREAVKPRIRYIKKLAAMKPALAIRDMRREFYDKYTTALSGEQATAHQDSAAETLEELEASAKRFDTVEAFLNHIDRLAAAYAEVRKHNDEDAVTLMTIHRAKGLEFPEVFMIGVSEGILPHRTALRDKAPADKQAAASLSANGNERIERSELNAQTKRLNHVQHRQGAGSISKGSMAPSGALESASTSDNLLEEERRLAYVAVTRAREQLYISSPALVHGQKAEISRFIREAWTLSAQ
ncbi:ATP-dependent helicase [Paenibacillus sp. 481]|nr:ATP-dependent helicase [Paenibacillus sp. 481]